MHSTLFVSLLALCLVSSSAQQETCSCDTLSSDIECVCASTSPPGELSVDDMPQFIIISNDDAVTANSDSIIRSITSDVHVNEDGCPIPATFFVSIQYTVSALVSALFEDGHEIATHTYTHPNVPSVDEIESARTWLSENADIPLGSIQGFRSPFLQHTPESRQFLSDLGFRYDASITEQASAFSGTTTDEQNRLFPYTLQNGVPQNCDIGTGAACLADESYPGMWEIPMWLIEDADGLPVTSMDLGADAEAYDLYMLEFERRYNEGGNRAPLGLFLHAGLVSPHVDEINRFLEYVLSLPDVWVITNSQLLDFMSYPMTADEYRQSRLNASECPISTTRRTLPPEGDNADDDDDDDEVSLSSSSSMSSNDITTPTMSSGVVVALQVVALVLPAIVLVHLY